VADRPAAAAANDALPVATCGGGYGCGYGGKYAYNKRGKEDSGMEMSGKRRHGPWWGGHHGGKGGSDGARYFLKESRKRNLNIEREITPDTAGRCQPTR